MAKDQKRELYQEMQSRLIASLLADGSAVERVLELVTEEDIEEPSLQLIFACLADLSRRNEQISQLAVAELLERQGKLREAGGPSTLYQLATRGEDYLLEASPTLYARVVKESSAKAKLTRSLQEAQPLFQDDSGVQASEAVSDLQAVLNENLLKLSDSSTITKLSEDMDEYLTLLETRKQVSEENRALADGLQGIPSLLPTLNKLTTGWLPGQIITVGARTGIGKALALDTPMLTTQGWKTMGTLAVGDFVFAPRGLPTRVTNVTEVMEGRTCYLVRFHNGATLVADADHQWVVQAGCGKLTLTTRELKALLLEQAEGGSISVTASRELSLQEQELPGEPYSFGYWLSLCMPAPPPPAMACPEEDLASPWTLQEKHIPPVYLQGSSEQRRALLAGLLEGNGSALPEAGCGEFKAHSERMAADFKLLAASLGMVTHAPTETAGVGNPSYSVRFECSFNPFRTPWKASLFKERDEGSSPCFFVAAVEEVPSVPVRCIEVEDEDHLYLAGRELIPTHNSIFAVDCAIAAAKAKKSVMFFSLEMSKTEIEDRVLAATTGITMNKLKQGHLTDEERRVLLTQMEEMKQLSLVIDVEPKLTVDAIRARALRQAQSPAGLDFIVVDYMQLITPVGRFSSRQEAVADISRNMKLLSKQLNVPIMVLVQLNRVSDKDEENALPKLDQIRESHAIAQDSDVVILLHRDQALDDSTPHTLVILAKNRNGEANKIIHTHSNLATSLFREVTRVKDVERLAEEGSEAVFEPADESFHQEALEDFVMDDFAAIDALDDDFDLETMEF